MRGRTNFPSCARPTWPRATPRRSARDALSFGGRDGGPDACCAANPRSDRTLLLVRSGHLDTFSLHRALGPPWWAGRFNREARGSILRGDRGGGPRGRLEALASRRVDSWVPLPGGYTCAEVLPAEFSSILGPKAERDERAQATYIAIGQPKGRAGATAVTGKALTRRPRFV